MTDRTNASHRRKAAAGVAQGDANDAQAAGGPNGARSVARLRRTSDQRLEHFARRIDQLAGEPALGAAHGWHVQLDAVEPVVQSEGPRREDVRSMLIELRKLDAPGEDTYLPGILDLLRARASDPGWREVLERARRLYEESQGVANAYVADREGAITRRQAFDLWLYADILHDDYDKEQRRNAAGTLGQGIVRSNALTYMRMLWRVARSCREVIERDPGLVSIPSPTRQRLI